MMAGNIEVGVAGGADSTSVSPIGVSKNLARALVDLQKTKTLGQKLAPHALEMAMASAAHGHIVGRVHDRHALRWRT